MADQIAALKQTLAQLDRALAAFEIDTAWRKRFEERQSSIKALCDRFHEQMQQLLQNSAERGRDNA